MLLHGCRALVRAPFVMWVTSVMSLAIKDMTYWPDSYVYRVYLACNPDCTCDRVRGNTYCYGLAIMMLPSSLLVELFLWRHN